MSVADAVLPAPASVYEQVIRDDAGRLHERRWLRSGLLHGVLLSYAANGWLARRATYENGRLHGEETVYGEPGPPLFTLSLPAGALRDGSAPDALRAAFAQHGIALEEAALLQTDDPGVEYSLASGGQWYTVSARPRDVAVQPGRLTRQARYVGGDIVTSERYLAGKREGEALRFGAPMAPLFTLPLECLPALESGALAALLPAFQRAKHPLPPGAHLIADHGGVEWRILAPDGTLTIRAVGGELVVMPGRVVERATFTQGELADLTPYSEGREHGAVLIFRPVATLGERLFALPESCRAALESAEVAALRAPFHAHGCVVQEEAALRIAVPGQEWFLAQPGQSYSIRREGAALGVYRGRVAREAGYRAGRLDGPTAVYDERGVVAQVMTFHEGALEGEMALYVQGQKQTSCEFRAGLADGRMATYDDRGQPAMVAHLRGGQLDGQLSLFQIGQPAVVAGYAQGKAQGKTVVYHPNRHECRVSQYVDGLLQGESLLYSVDGVLIQRAEYVGGMLHGQVLDYYPSGQVRQRAHYARNTLDGPFFVYDLGGHLLEERVYQAGKLTWKRAQTSPLRRLWQS